MAFDSAAAAECPVVELPPAIPSGMEAALGVPAAQLTETLAVQLSDFELETITSINTTDGGGAGAGDVYEGDHRQMRMPDFWQAVADENDLASPAQARAVIGTALRIATTQARDHGSFRMGNYVKFTRVKRGTEMRSSSVDMTPLAKVQKHAQ